MKKILGVNFEEENGKQISVKYIEKLSDSYNKYKIPITSLPISKGIILSKDQCPKT